MNKRREKELGGYEMGDIPARGRNDKVVRIMDPVHNFIDVSEYPVVLDLINTPHFQRLKSLQQLGLASVVYPNATHTRFAHSIGVMHVFLTLFDSVAKTSRLGPKKIAWIRPVGAVAALLHDVGHGPLSHVSERFLESGRFDHERMTRDIICASPVSGILRRNGIDPALVTDILKREAPADLRFVSQLLSSQLDADRMDYLVRDSLFTGLQYGRIDMHRIASTMRLWDGDEPEHMQGTVVVDSKGIEAVANYILARYFMYDGVYQHKTIRCAETMLAKAFARASTLSGAGAAPGMAGKVSPRTLLSLDDHTCYALLREWSRSGDRILSDLSSRLLLRNLFKTVVVNNPLKGVNNLLQSQDLGRAFKSHGLDVAYYCIGDEQVLAGYRPYSVTDSDDLTATNPIMIVDASGEPKEISRLSGIVDATTSMPTKPRLFCPGSVVEVVTRVLGDHGH